MYNFNEKFNNEQTKLNIVLRELGNLKDYPNQREKVYENLKKNNGKQVEIEYYRDGKLEKEERTLDFFMGGVRVTDLKHFRMPIVGEYTIAKITEKENGNVIFKNSYYKEDEIIQAAYILGREDAEEIILRRQEAIKDAEKRYFEKNYSFKKRKNKKEEIELEK